MSKALIIIGLLLFSLTQSFAATSDKIKLRCEMQHTNPYAAPPEGELSYWIFDLDLQNQEIYMSRENTDPIKLGILFWDNAYIGAANPYNGVLGPSITTYLFSRSKGELLLSYLDDSHFNRETRKGLHGMARLNGFISELLFKCARVGGF